MSKQARWYRVFNLFVAQVRGGATYETASLSIRDVADGLGVSRTTAKKYLSSLVNDGLLIEDYDPEYGRFGIYQYWLSESVVEWA